MTGVKRALLLSTGERYFALASNFIVTAIVSRLLTPSEIGVSVIGMAIVGLAMAGREFASPNFLIQHRDLDLRTEAGTRTLDRRIWRAVVEVCGKAPDYDIEGKNDVRQCRRDTRALASAQADAVIADATRDQPIRVSSIRK